MNFKRGDLALTGGYYGSFYDNHVDSLPANAPDNQAHQLYMSGNYAVSPTTRANFRLSYTHATQNDDVDSLDGVVDTTLAQIGLTTRPTRQLTVNASLRYEDRDDKSSLPESRLDGNVLPSNANWPSGSQSRTSASLDGIYRLQGGYTVSMGLDWERKLAPLPPVVSTIGSNLLFFRPELEETSVSGTVRKAMSETLNGALGFEYKKRRGDDNAWVPPVDLDQLPANQVLPTLYMDRDRATWRASLDWSPTEVLTLDLVAEQHQDQFERGLADPTQNVKTDTLALDAGYRVSENWHVNGFWTASRNRWRVSTGLAGDDTLNTARTVGINLKGKLTARVNLGADLLVGRDVTTRSGLSDITYRTSELRLYGTYDIDQKSGVRVTLVHYRFETDDVPWSYNGNPYVYANNASVSQNPNQSVNFIGLAYTYQFN